MMKNNDVRIWVIDGQILTDRPEAFESDFFLPTCAPVDGLTRVSHRPGEMKRPKPKADRTEALTAWLAGEEA